jgi:hypothetical protein
VLAQKPSVQGFALTLSIDCSYLEYDFQSRNGQHPQKISNGFLAVSRLTLFLQPVMKTEWLRSSTE